MSCFTGKSGISTERTSISLREFLFSFEFCTLTHPFGGIISQPGAGGQDKGGERVVITIPREGQAAPPPQIDQASRDRLWACIVKSYIARHPEQLESLKGKPNETNNRRE